MSKIDLRALLQRTLVANSNLPVAAAAPGTSPAAAAAAKPGMSSAGEATAQPGMRSAGETTAQPGMRSAVTAQPAGAAPTSSRGSPAVQRDPGRRSAVHQGPPVRPHRALRPRRRS